MGEPQEERFDERHDVGQTRRKLNGPGYLWAGLFMLLVGGVLLLDQMGFPLPDWLFHWPILLIAIGLFLGLRHNFRGGAWLILILVGGCFMIQDFYPKVDLRRFIAPMVLIFIGLMIIFRPKRSWRHHPWNDHWKAEMHAKMHEKWQQKWDEKHWDKAQKHWDRWGQKHMDKWNRKYGGDPYNRRWSPPGGFGGPGGANDANGPSTPGTSPSPNAAPNEPSTDPSGATNPGPANQAGPESNQNPGSGGIFTNAGGGYTSEDFIDTTSIFGGVHKKVMSKNFRGGDIVTILGGSEIDLSQAEIHGTARLDVTQVMGGTKIIVPGHWEVRTEVNALFAGFEDKRQQPATINPEKILIIDGTSIFGGIELKNY